MILPMERHIARVLIHRDAIARRVCELADQIADDFGRHGDEAGVAPPLPARPDITIVPILTGSIVFLADLIRQLPLMARLRFLTIESYPGKSTTSRGPIIDGELPADLAGASVLIVDDVLDSGRTLQLAQQKILERQPAQMRTCVMLRKDVPTAAKPAVDYIGFDIPDEFVVGYGLDYDGYYRNLPDVVTLRSEVFA
ncbi:MAG: hypoxanthine phosphoribosyltransferase [Planctomycetaceae bacterium]|nr:hypoxanthine phosphoribosyltransferase [Planctomycetaceae bacterium]